MTPEEQALSDAAHRYIKEHSDEVIKQFSGNSVPVATPVSLFMAGSPGAGKTEVSKGLIRQFDTMPVRIDADEIRAMCPGYTGANAHVFQKAATKGVHILYDHVLAKGLHAILDGTFAYADAIQNIQRSIDRGRKTELWFVYQEPTRAWEFTKAREAIESRRVSKETFIKGFMKSKDNAKEAKAHLGSRLNLNLLIKNLNNTDGTLHLNIQSEELDRYTAPAYTQEELDKLLV